MPSWDTTTIGTVGFDGHGRWEPLPLDEAVALFKAAPFRWWVSGGHALELHLNRSWRDHDDTDISILRDDAEQLRGVLPGWDIHVAAAGILTQWDGGPLSATRSENNLWCRPAPDDPWSLDVTISDGDEDDWIYRRNPTIRRAWPEAVLTTADDVPYLAPELQLLFKIKNHRSKDDLDAATVIPELDLKRRSWLDDHILTGHPWQRYIRTGPA